MKSFNQWKEAAVPLQNDVKHIVGNSVFAIETNLQPLKKRIVEGRKDEAIEIVNSIETSIQQIVQFLTTMENQ